MKNISPNLQLANKGLSRCSLVAHGGRLYIRSTRFPPKPGSKSKRPELATGFRANVRELKLALAVAQQVDGQLVLGIFKWEPWLPQSQQKPTSIGQWLERLEADYWQRRDRTPKTKTTWSNYLTYFSRLPLEQSLSVDILKQRLIECYKPGSRSRQACSVAYGMLAAFAGLDRREISELGKGYKSPKKTSEDILHDDQILFQLDNIPNREWQCAAALLAVFGLRNHEIFKCDLGRIEEGVIRILPDTKTGERLCYACPPEWIARYQLRADMELPKVAIAGRTNQTIGRTVTRAFLRYHLCNPYKFRDAYAVRLEFYWDAGTPSAFKARWMGHSSSVHDENYLDAIQEIHHEKMYSRLRSQNHADGSPEIP